MSRTRRAAGLLAIGLAAGALALAAPAEAHVTVASSDAAPGGYGVVAVRVPTESDTASTTKVVLQLPTATPLQSVDVQPTVGWADAEKTSKLPKPVTTDDGDTVTTAVSQVTWTATAGGIKPGHFQQFFLSAGPFPKARKVVFKAVQYYSDGTVVRWVETPAPGSTTEPDHPAPTLKLTAATPAAATTSTAPAASASHDSGRSDTGPIVLSIIALVVAVGALAFGLVSRARAKGSAQ